MTFTPKLTLTTLSIAFALTSLGCSSLNTPKQIQSKIIETHRTNITTSRQVSGVANSILLSSGLTQEECMAEFGECLARVKEVLSFGRSPSSGSESSYPAKPVLALLSELYYAKALDLGDQDACKNFTRPPIDDYYANAPLSDSEQADQDRLRQACLSARREAIKASINHSYGYLFYDNLTGQNTTSALVSESDIKAQDLYHVASNALIGEIYQQKNGVFADAKQQGSDFKTAQYGHVLANSYQTDDMTVNLYINRDFDRLANLDETRDDKEHLLSDLVSAYDSRLVNLNVTSSRPGLGVPYVGVLSDRQTITVKQLVNQVTQNQLQTEGATESAPHDASSDIHEAKLEDVTSDDLALMADVTTNTATPIPDLLVNHDIDSLAGRIHLTGYNLLTGVVKPQGQNLTEVTSSDVLDVHFFNPYKTKEVDILGKNYPLSANYSAGYALWLAENQLQGVSILSMLNKNEVGLPRLFMLKPYDPNQKVIIMIHGLASSPATWVNLTNNLFADPVLRDNYQVWQISYATNLPMLENRYQIRKLINAAYQITDPHGVHPASKNSVIIGHSMGGIMARMLVSNDNLLPRLDALDKSLHKDESLDEPSDESLHGSNESEMNSLWVQTNDIIEEEATTTSLVIDDALMKELLANAYADNFNHRFTLEPLPQVDTAVFISAPFAGTDYADRWFTRFARRVVRLPLDLTKAVTSSIANHESVDIRQLQNTTIGSLYLQNGPSQLSDRSMFIKLTKELSIDDQVTYHTIMGDYRGSAEELQGNLVGQNLSDGIVPYDSSHLEGAMSETIITGGHNIHENPKTILQLRKILHEHLDRHQK